MLHLTEITRSVKHSRQQVDYSIHPCKGVYRPYCCVCTVHVLLDIWNVLNDVATRGRLSWLRLYRSSPSVWASGESFPWWNVTSQTGQRHEQANPSSIEDLGARSRSAKMVVWSDYIDFGAVRGEWLG